MTADPAKQPGLAPFDERGIEQRLFVDRVARPRAGEDVGDDRIGLCKREQNRVAEERLAAAEKLRHAAVAARERSEEHTSELQSLMRISYAVFCLKKKKRQLNITSREQTKTRATTQKSSENQTIK